MNLLKDKVNSNDKEKLVRKILLEPDLIYKERLLDYLDDKEVQPTLLITFYDLFIRVWARIEVSPYKAELIQRLNQEMHNAERLCSIDRLSRLVNVLTKD